LSGKLYLNLLLKMINLNYEDIINKIKEDKGLSDNEIKSKVTEKLNQLGDNKHVWGSAYCC